MESAKINGRGPSRFAGNSGFKGMIVMKVSATALHILPGKTRELLDFACDIREGRRAEHEGSARRLGISAERYWVETTNEGDVLIMYLEGGDLEKTNRLFGVSDDPYDLWFQTRMRGITGIDLGKPEAAGPSELVFESPVLRPEVPAGALATAMPILPGRKGEWLEFIGELSSSRMGEYCAYLYRYGFTRERFFLQYTPHGLMAILYVEGKNPAGAIASFARFHHPFDAWMREEMLFLNGIDFIRRASAPDLVLDWKAEPKREAA